MIPLKETINFAKAQTGNTAPAVRQAGIQLLKEIYKHIGDSLRVYIEDIKDATLKTIDAELGKTKVYEKQDHQPSRKLRGSAAQ